LAVTSLIALDVIHAALGVAVGSRSWRTRTRCD